MEILTRTKFKENNVDFEEIASPINLSDKNTIRQVYEKNGNVYYQTKENIEKPIAKASKSMVAIDMPADVELLNPDDSFIVMEDMNLPTIPVIRAKKGDIYNVIVASPDLEVYLQGNIENVPVTEKLPASVWVAEENGNYKYACVVTLRTRLMDSTKVKLINDDLLLFSKYGFGILSVTGQKVKILALDNVTESVTFTIEVGGV